jgi:hypothetical protein
MGRATSFVRLSGVFLFCLLCAAISGFAGTVTVWDNPIDVPCGGLTGDCPTSPDAVVINFNDTATFTGSVYTSGIATFTFNTVDILGNAATGSPFVSASVAGEYAAPGQDGDTSQYMTLGSPNRPSSVAITFSTPILYYGFYMGSPDAYNTMTFHFTDGSAPQTLTGMDLVGLSGDPEFAPASWGSADYFGFGFSGAVSGIDLSSNQAAFETDNHAFIATPEPEAAWLIGLGLVGIVAGRIKLRRRAA